MKLQDGLIIELLPKILNVPRYQCRRKFSVCYNRGADRLAAQNDEDKTL